MGGFAYSTRDSAWKSPTAIKLGFSPPFHGTERTEPPYELLNSDSRRNPYFHISTTLSRVKISYPQLIFSDIIVFGSEKITQNASRTFCDTIILILVLGEIMQDMLVAYSEFYLTPRVLPRCGDMR